ncbi:MAG: DegT/DnrJ/EryC1/StrS family aminotransferase [Actinomycetaceae bacterium]|nr:DegT/DnrJ/EryC1/StrS family aminotransferase [Actinomycetaceae bacterium]
MHIPFSPPDIRQEDIDAVVDVLKSGWITSGPVGTQFAQALTEYCDAAGTVLVNSCTAGLELALVALGVGPGDEVIVPAYTYTASASVIHHVGATIVMVDVAPGSYFVDPSTWENAITERTKAIIAVDIAGVMNDTTAIYRAIENRKELFHPTNSLQEKIGRVALIIDAAHSLGAVRNGAISGSVADLTAFSFHAVKNLTTGEGGALCWSKNLPVDHDDFERTLRILCLHGQDKSALEKMNAAAWEYDILTPAFKWNLADIMAALGLSQLKRYPEIISRRHEIIDRYDDILSDTPTTSLMHVGEDFRSSGHLYLLTLTGYSVAQRNAFIDDMYEAGVSCNVHYKPLPELTAYQNLGFSSADYPQALAQYTSEVTLPLHTCLSDEQVEYVASTARNLILK